MSERGEIGGELRIEVGRLIGEEGAEDGVGARRGRGRQACGARSGGTSAGARPNGPRERMPLTASNVATFTIA